MERINFIIISAVCAIVAMTAVSCGNDDDDSTTVPASVMQSLPGFYSNVVTFDDKAVLCVMNVEVTTTTATFNLPWEAIFEYVMGSGSAEAAASVRASDVTATYRPVYYNNNVASLLMDTQTVNFRYTLDGAERTGQLTLSTPSIAYDSVNKQLRVGMSISKVVLGGEEVKSFKPVHFYMQPSEKKN